MHRLLEQQVREATRSDGEFDLGKLFAAIDCRLQQDR